MSLEDSASVPSTKPYLIRALFEWCEDNGFTPYLAVMVDDTVQVPHEYVNNGEIVLNISSDATGGLVIGNDWIEFKARFAGVPREILVPVGRVIAIYARENGQGMSFPIYEMPEEDAHADVLTQPVLSLASSEPSIPDAETPLPPSPPSPTSPSGSKAKRKPNLKLDK